MDNDFARFLDTLNKLVARNKMPTGGSQYTMDVAQGVSGSAKGQAYMRNQKVQPIPTMPLRALIAKHS